MGFLDLIRAVIRWVFRRRKTNFQDKLDRINDGWSSNIPFLRLFENAIIGACFSIILLFIISKIIRFD